MLSKMGELDMPRIDAARVKRMLVIALCGVLPAGIASPAEHGRLAPTLVSMVEQVQDGRIVLQNTATVMQGVP